MEFRYYEPDKFRQLTKAQKNELREHRKKNGQGTPPKGQSKKTMKSKLCATISSAIKKEMKSLLRDVDEGTPVVDKGGKEDIMGQALIAALKKVSNNEKEGATATISALAWATKPKDKPTVAKPKSFCFGPEVASPSNANKVKTGTEVAVSGS